MMTTTDFKEKMTESSLVVAHAGMGVVITAAESLGRPIVLLPRMAARQEHTTDHQLHTAARLIGRPGIFVASTTAELPAKIAGAEGTLEDPRQLLATTAPTDFVQRIRDFLTA